MPPLLFEGTVFSGRGEGRRFVELPWVQRQIMEKLGFSPYAGTLNIRLTAESAAKRGLLDAAQGYLVTPEEGYCPGVLFRAKLGGEECAVVLPKIPDYPKDVIEIVAPHYLRGKLGLADDSLVAVEVTF